MLQVLREKIVALLDEDRVAPDADRHRHAVRLATATLMAEVARADGVLDARELARLGELMRERFDLSESEASMVLREGLDGSEQAVSLQAFTRTLHEALPTDEKSEIVGMLWDIAAADGDLDKYEDAAIAKIADLLYVPRSEVLRLKHKAGL